MKPKALPTMVLELVRRLVDDMRCHVLCTTTDTQLFLLWEAKGGDIFHGTDLRNTAAQRMVTLKLCCLHSQNSFQFM